MRLATMAGVAGLLGSVPVFAQSRTPMQALPDALPATANTPMFALTGDARRAYYLTAAGEVWLYDRASTVSTRVAVGNPWDLTVSPARDALAYTKGGAKRTDQFVWLATLDPKTGLAAGPERRVSPNQGDVPSISPDGKWVAFARDDSTGVGQSIVVVPVGGGAERVVAPSLPASVDHIRWTPDGKTLYFGVNPPVACVPDWSCLPLKDARTPAGTIRRAAVAGGPVTVIATVRGSSPGLSPDGTLLVYADTGNVRRMVVADVNGRRLDTFVLSATQTAPGWLSGATLLVRTSGIVRRVRSYTLAGGQSHQLFESADRLIEPSWSRDGKMISAIRCPVDGTPCEMRIMNADGSLRKALPMAEMFANTIAWSPDQRWISYSGQGQNAPPHVTAMEIATGRAVQLADISQSEYSSVLWLPDSRGVIVSQYSRANTQGRQDRQLTFRRIDLTGKSTLLRESALSVPGFGRAIDATTALVSRSPARDHRIVRLTGDTSERVILAALPGFSSPAAFSADMQWLAIKRNKAGTDNNRLNVLELLRTDGTAHTTIELPFFAWPGVSNPLILPGGKQVILLEYPRSDVDPGVYLVTVATKEVKKLLTYPMRPVRPGVPELSLSPDGRTLVYSMWEALTPTVATMDLALLRQTRH